MVWPFAKHSHYRSAWRNAQQGVMRTFLLGKSVRIVPLPGTPLESRQQTSGKLPESARKR